MAEPTPIELWDKAGGDGEEYRRLMREHGHLVKKECGCEGPCEHQNLPCGWPHKEEE